MKTRIVEIITLAALFLCSRTALPCSILTICPNYPRNGDVDVPLNALLVIGDGCQLLDSDSNAVDLAYDDRVMVNSECANYYVRSKEALLPHSIYTTVCPYNSYQFTTGIYGDYTPPSALSDVTASTEAENPIPFSTFPMGGCEDRTPPADVRAAKLVDELTPEAQLRIATCNSEGRCSPYEFPTLAGDHIEFSTSQYDWTTRVAVVDGAGNMSEIVTIKVDWNGGCDCRSVSANTSILLFLPIAIFCLTRRWSGMLRAL